MLLALLTALRFRLISFFGGRWCSFAQMGFSFERLTRPRNTIVTNLFIIALPLSQAWDFTITPFPGRPLKPTAVRALGKCCRGDLGGKYTCCMCYSEREGGGRREGGRQAGRQRAGEKKQQERGRERDRERWGGITEWWVWVPISPSLGLVSLVCAGGCNTNDSLLMRVVWWQLWLSGRQGHCHLHLYVACAWLETYVYNIYTASVACCIMLQWASSGWGHPSFNLWEGCLAGPISRRIIQTVISSHHPCHSFTHKKAARTKETDLEEERLLRTQT